MKQKQEAKQKRMLNINELIKLIGSRDRKFLSSHSDDYDTKCPLVYCTFFFKNGKLFLRDKYTKKEIKMEQRYVQNIGFSSGGTLWGLVRDFANFILTGYYSNGKHGYGGLYCPHWGYSEESMEEIRKFAVKINYIVGNYEKDRELYVKLDEGENFILETENAKDEK